MAIVSERLAAGDVVELTSLPKGRTNLRVGMVGRVVVGNGLDDLAEFGWISVVFTNQQHPHLLSPRHLKLVERGPGPDDDEGEDA